MQILNVVLTSIGSIIVLFFSTKLIGNKQMSELNMFDYINGITIGSIAAEMATSLEGDFLLPLVSMVIYTIAVLLISYASQKSLKARRFLTGRCIVLMDKGKIFQRNFFTAKLDLNEFLTQCRINGYFNLDDIECAILEQNGKISFLPKVTTRPVNTQDLNLAPQQERPTTNVILDGQVLDENLKQTGNNRDWLNKKLKEQNISDMTKVFVASCDDNNKLSVYMKVEDAPQNDQFE